VYEPGPRIAGERRNLQGMIRIFCRGHHRGGRSICPECEELRAYAWKRLEKCPYQEAKPTCADCPIHCYQPERRVQVRSVMRYAGPRMIYLHPIMALRHWLHGRSSPPKHPRLARRMAAEEADSPHHPDCLPEESLQVPLPPLFP
jgi:hypothetical protein